MEDIVYFNGTLVPRQEAMVSPFDRGFLYGYGLFETMRSYKERVFRLDRHLTRLRLSAQRLALASELEAYDLEQAIYKTLEANKLADARIRLTVSAGPGERGLAPPVGGQITVLVFADELVLSPQAYEQGIAAAMVGPRRNSLSPLSRIKATNYEGGGIAEGSMSNIFLVAEGMLLTPSEESGILPGITREAVLELARALGIEAVEGEIPLADLLRADEAFLTSSVREVLPITSIDNEPVGQGGPGPVTRRLMAAYSQLVETTLELSRR